MSLLAAISANPSLSITYRLDNLSPGKVHRLHAAQETADGKGITVARVLKRLGAEPVVVFPSGGDRGKRIEEILGRESIAFRVTRIEGEVRRTYVLLSGEGVALRETQLLEPGPRLSAKECRDFSRQAALVCREAVACSITGSLPEGVSADFYLDLIRRLKAESSVTVVLDTSGAPLSAALRASPDVLKVNEREFHELMNHEGDVPSRVTMAKMRTLADQHSMSAVIVTRGAKSVRVWTRQNGYFEISPPKLETVSTVGAGDCFMAGLLSRLHHGLPDAVCLAVATASASVVRDLPGDVDIDLAKRLYRDLRSTLDFGAANR